MYKYRKKTMDFFKALAQDSRVKIWFEVLKGKEQSLTVLAKKFNMTQPAITQHVNILENAGTVKTTYSRGTRGAVRTCTATFKGFLEYLIRAKRKPLNSLNVEDYKKFDDAWLHDDDLRQLLISAGEKRIKGTHPSIVFFSAFSEIINKIDMNKIKKTNPKKYNRIKGFIDVLVKLGYPVS